MERVPPDMTVGQSANLDEWSETQAKRELRRLAAYVIQHHLPEIRNGESVVDYAIRCMKAVRKVRGAIGE